MLNYLLALLTQFEAGIADAKKQMRISRSNSFKSLLISIILLLLFMKHTHLPN